MAQGKTTVITTIKIDNAKAETTIPAKAVEVVVVNNALVPDKKDTNPGVHSDSKHG